MVRYLLIILILCPVVFQSCSNSAAERSTTKISGDKGFAVIELFTSEGCSSCPPADDLASTIQQNADKEGQKIFVLCEHVDYWNRLGWKDPFSKPFYSERQKWYAGFLKDEGIYTPQMVVNGITSFVGSDKAKAYDAINHALSSIKSNYTLQLSSTDFSTGNISYSISPANNDDLLNIVLVEKNVVSNVLRGENKGKLLHHNNVVRDWITVEHPAQSGVVQFKSDSLKINKDKFEVISFVQDKNSGEISLATSLK